VLLLLVAACSDDDPEPTATPTSEPDPCARPEPEGGWFQPERLYDEGDSLTDTVDAPALALDVELPAGFTIDNRTSWADADGCPRYQSVDADAEGGAFVFVVRRYLRLPASFFNIPLSGWAHTVDDDGTVVVRDDFNGNGNRLTVIVISPDGVLTRAVAAGAGAPNLAGWPTTVTTPPNETTVPPQPAPLSFDELEELARAAQGAGRSTNR
jgi:hypothetical protein